MEDIKELKAKAAALEPLVRIGKSGISESVLGEIKKHLQVKKLIKIKMLKSFVENGDKKALAKQIADKTESEIISAVGFVVVLHKK